MSENLSFLSQTEIIVYYVVCGVWELTMAEWALCVCLLIRISNLHVGESAHDISQCLRSISINKNKSIEMNEE